MVQAENRQLGLAVDRICDTQEIVVKPLGRQLKSLPCYVGATIMGDGKPALILDVAGLSRLAGLFAQPRHPSSKAAGEINRNIESEMLLLFRAGRFERVAVPLALVDRLEEIRTETIERAAGRPVLHYRGEILPLVTLDAGLSERGAEKFLAQATAHVVVFSREAGRVGLLVDQILDIVDEVVTAQHSARSVPGLSGSAVIAGRITDLLDLRMLVASAGDDRFAREERTPPVFENASLAADELEAMLQ